MQRIDIKKILTGQNSFSHAKNKKTVTLARAGVQSIIDFASAFADVAVPE